MKHTSVLKSAIDELFDGEYVSDVVTAAANIWVDEDPSKLTKKRLLSLYLNEIDAGKKLVSVLNDIKRLKRSVQKLKNKGEDPDSELGRWAFPNNRWNDDIKEPDTSEEKHLFRKIDTHFTDSTGFDDDAIRLIKKFLKSGMYGDVFVAPKDGVTIYRGISVSKAWLRAALKQSDFKNRGAKDVSFALKSHRRSPASSWSSSEAVSRNFSRDTATHLTPYAVMVEATVDNSKNNFLKCKGGLYKLNIIGIDNEDEIIALAPVKVHAITWKNMYDYDDY